MMRMTNPGNKAHWTGRKLGRERSWLACVKQAFTVGLLMRGLVIHLRENEQRSGLLSLSLPLKVFVYSCISSKQFRLCVLMLMHSVLFDNGENEK